VRASRIEEDTSVQLWKVQQSEGKAGNWGLMVYSFHNVVTLT